MRAPCLATDGIADVYGALYIVPLWMIAAAAAVLLLALVLLFVGLLRRRRRVWGPPEPDLFVDIGQLAAAGPPADGPRIEFYGTPVRLAVVVIAPAGRQGELPPPGVMPTLLDRLVPGLPAVVAHHQPLICRWPAQLSTQGFAQSFFNHLVLPGDRGKGTPWCSIAGRLQVGDRMFLVGLVCCASQPNALSQFVVQHEGQWLDILRIRDV
jgi:hypothetical protein